jgi:hypothetical protein
LQRFASSAKIELSSVTETVIAIPVVTATSSGPKHLEMKLARTKFNELTHGLVERCRKPVEEALKDAGLSLADLMRRRFYNHEPTNELISQQSQCTMLQLIRRKSPNRLESIRIVPSNIGNQKLTMLREIDGAELSSLCQA